MFGVDWSEFLLIGAVALVVIGPKDLPHTLYNLGKFARKMRQYTGALQKSIDDVMKEGELDDITRTLNAPGGESMQFEIERQIQAEAERDLLQASSEPSSRP